MGCNCGKNKVVMTAAAVEAERQARDLERRINEETAKASGKMPPLNANS